MLNKPHPIDEPLDERYEEYRKKLKQRTFLWKRKFLNLYIVRRDGFLVIDNQHSREDVFTKEEIIEAGYNPEKYEEWVPF